MARIRARQAFIAAVLTVSLSPRPFAQSPAPAPALRIVVVAGEGAVNVVQQGTVVAPVIEVRDRNNQPVAGVAVRFAIRRGRATLNGVRAISVVTDAAGRATVTGLAPTGAGTLQISATAAFQGQTAAATIVQTNVMTAAQAATISGAAGGGAAGGGGVAGGGLSATTLSIVGGAAAAGTVVTVRQLQGTISYAGPYSGVMVWRGGPTCSHQSRISATVVLELKIEDDGALSGTSHTSGSSESAIENLSSTCPNPPPMGVVSDYYWLNDPPVTGTKANLTFHGEAGLNPVDWVFDFVGTFNDDAINATLTHTWVNRATGVVQGTVQTPVTLTKR